MHHYGRPICDDITDKARPFGINIDNELVIPFTVSGTNIYFQSQVPSQWELSNCRTFVITHDSTWDPTTVIIASVTPTRELLHNNHVSIDELLLLLDVYDKPTFMSWIVSAGSECA
jgi:hypothetical protein